MSRGSALSGRELTSLLGGGGGDGDGKQTIDPHAHLFQKTHTKDEDDDDRQRKQVYEKVIKRRHHRRNEEEEEDVEEEEEEDAFDRLKQPSLSMKESEDKDLDVIMPVTREPMWKEDQKEEKEKEKAKDVVVSRRQRSASSSSSDSDSDSGDSSSSDSSSEDDDAVEDRRRRIRERAKARRDEALAVSQQRKSMKGTSSSSGGEEGEDDVHARESVGKIDDHQRTKRTNGQSSAVDVPRMKEKRRRSDDDSLVSSSAASSSSGGSSSSSSSSDDSSTTSSSDSEEGEPMKMPIAEKPIFVTKHKRNRTARQEEEIEEMEKIKAMKETQTKKRKEESRLLVAKVVQHASKSSMLALNKDENGWEAMPDDNDLDFNVNSLEYQNWSVRELVRILREFDRIEEEEAEKNELARRRKMTDEERLMEDRRLGKFNRRSKDDYKKMAFMQRYYHKGAFYMDDETLKDKDDIRNKAKDYALAATCEDKYDKSKLPEVMQVKNFGIARRSTKYKGLAKEDTTDRTKDYLPLASRKSKKY